MKSLKMKGLGLLSLILSVYGSSFGGGLSSITNNAENYQIIFLNNIVTFVTTDWSMLSNYYNQNSTFPPANSFAINTSFLPGVESITNTSSGTLEIRFGATAPGPMAGNGFALAPTRVSVHKLFYVYDLAKCFTNITDSMTTQQAPNAGTSINLFSNSNLGVICVYAENPFTAAVNQVNGVV